MPNHTSADGHHGIPSDAVFCGREPELAALRASFLRAADGEAQLAVVEGPAGIGKTALVGRFLRAEKPVRLLRARDSSVRRATSISRAISAAASLRWVAGHR